MKIPIDSDELFVYSTNTEQRDTEMQDVTLIQGHYRGKELNDIQCQMTGVLKQGARGWFGHFNIPGYGNIRVQVPSEAY